MTLYLLHYNNFYNHHIMVEDTLSDYLQYQIGSPITNVNFIPGDGVDTQQIVNWNDNIPDYLIALDSDNTFTRWFVIEAERTRGGQLLLHLHRDVIADNLASFKQSTAFIRRGWLSNGNPLIFNSEGNSFNQIKQGEVLLENNIGSPWLVLYLSRYNNKGALNTFSGRFTTKYSSSIEEYNSMSDYPFYQFYISERTYVNPANICYGIMCEAYRPDEGDGTAPYWDYYYGLYSGGAYLTSMLPHHANSSNYPDRPDRVQAPSGAATYLQDAATAYIQANQNINGVPLNSYTNWTTTSGYQRLLEEDNKVIKVGGNYYRIQVVSNTYQDTLSTFASYASYKVTNGSALDNAIDQFNRRMVETSNKTVQNVVFIRNSGTTNYVTRVKLNMQLLSEYAENDVEYTFTFPGVITADAVYEILACPMYTMQITDSTGTHTHRGDVAIQWFQDIMSRYGSAGFAYDLQVLPYCPVDTTDWTEYTTYYLQPSTGTGHLATCINLDKSSFFQTLDVELPVYESNNKIANETLMYRIVSPNGVGEYEFSPNKNGGLTQIHVDCTLKPYNPYIQVHPVWGWMYGDIGQEDFRGLICQGDFSLPSLSNEWSTYELNNKNYQAIFDRQIQSQDYQRTWQRASDIVGAVAGTVGGIAGGVIAGSVLGPGGAIAGGIAGGAFSAGGGVADVIANEQIYQEQRQASIETFQMNLGNVKARANTLARGTSYNIDSKYFPIIEYFSCTEEELDAFNNYLKYRGMTVEAIGMIEDYLNPEDTTYIQGDLIDIDITDDYHMAREIANVLKGGVRIDA